MDKKSLLCYIFLIGIIGVSLEKSENNTNNVKEIRNNDVTFKLFNKNHQKINNAINLLKLENVDLDATKPFKFIIHGYTDNAEKKWVQNMKNEYLKKGDYNIITVDWSKPALLLYPLSVAYTRIVGIYTANLITNLNKTLNVPLEDIHVIGHSLGAHAAGYTGKYVYRKLNMKIGRITGLDPAGPLFVGVMDNLRLSPKDANFVDAIHTDGYKNGYFDPLGHADFYVNGGTAIQPGCFTENLYKFAICSHIRSYLYFTESINSEKFMGTQCGNFIKYISGLCYNNSVAIMGENIDKKSRGIFHLLTESKSPYARS